jgi:germination protein M
VSEGAARTRTLVTAAALVALFLLVTLSAPFWSGLLRTPAGGATPGEYNDDAAEPAPAASTPTTARLFFLSTASDRPGLLIEERALAPAPDLSHAVRLTAEAVLAGPQGQAELRPTFPAGARVLDAFVTPRGIAIVNLSKEAAAPGRGTDGELLTVYSLVNSLISSFPSLKRVQILVESSPTLTLGGHVDLSRPLPADLSLMAVDGAETPATP